MSKPIASVPTNKRSVLLGGVAAATILAMIFLLLSPNGHEDNQEKDQPTGDQHTIATSFENDNFPATPTQDTSDNMSSIAGAGRQPAATDRINIEQPANTPAAADSTGDDSLYIAPPAMLTTSNSVPASGSSSSVTELELARELKTRLEQTEKRLQTLQIQLNEQIQYAQKKANESQRWQDAAVQMEETMKKIIDDNNREAEQMASEIEHWREQALTAGRQNASLAERQRRSAAPVSMTLQQPPPTSPAPAQTAPRPLPPLQLQTPAPAQSRTPPAQAAPQPPVPPPEQSNFTTTCYDPNRGYFPCTVRQ
jgi:gas vesicle protein